MCSRTHRHAYKTLHIYKLLHCFLLFLCLENLFVLCLEGGVFGVFLCFVLFFEAESHYVDLARLECAVRVHQAGLKPAVPPTPVSRSSALS